MSVSEDRIVILGSSKGLGLAIAKASLERADTQLLLCSRNIESAILPPNRICLQPRIQKFSADFSKAEALSIVLSKIDSFDPTRIFYCAGGGPFGPFSEKPWHSHEWSLQVNFLFPAKLLHSILSGHQSQSKALKQIVFVGSAVAESLPDVGASSYAAGKQALRGLLQNIILENNQPILDLRLYSPGYMNTGMLPKNARPRLNGSSIAEPEDIAADFLSWVEQPAHSDNWHRVTAF